MSDVTILSVCEENKEFCDRIESIIGEDLYKHVEDDWRRPIVNGVLYSVLYYGLKKEYADKIKQILEILGYSDIYEAIVKSLTGLELKEIQEQVYRLLKQAEEIMKKYEELLR